MGRSPSNKEALQALVEKYISVQIPDMARFVAAALISDLPSIFCDDKPIELAHEQPVCSDIPVEPELGACKRVDCYRLRQEQDAPGHGSIRASRGIVWMRLTITENADVLLWGVANMGMPRVKHSFRIACDLERIAESDLLYIGCFVPHFNPKPHHVFYLGEVSDNA